MPPTKKPSYHPHLCNSDLKLCSPKSKKPEDFAIEDEDSESDYDYNLSPAGSLSEVQPQWPADETGTNVVEVVQCEDTAGRPGSCSTLQVEEISGGQAAPSKDMVQKAPKSTFQDWSDTPGQQRREFDIYSLDSDVSHSDSDISYSDSNYDIDESELELGNLDDEEALFDADCNDHADNEPFEWRNMAEFAARRETFTSTAGPTRSFPDPYSAFTAIWDESIMKHICTETNRYFIQEMEKEVRAEHSRTKYWHDTNVHEMYLFFAIILLMGMVRMPNVECYFSHNHLLNHSAFGYIMSKHRYRLLSSFLHFVNNEDLVENYKGNKKLFKAQPIIDHCNKKFKQLYIPSQNIAVDESLTLWRGRLSWRQYIKRKAARFGIKTFKLCESATGYLWSFTVYTGEDTTSMVSTILPKGANKTTKIVLTLIEPLLNKGYTVWMDKWFNSPLLARFLKIRQTDCAGTLRACRKDVPKDIGNRELASGEIFGLASNFCAVLAWLDKRRVSMISTFHENQMVEVRRRGRRIVMKPDVVHDYNLHIGGVDKKDQMTNAFLVERTCCKKWFIKFFKRLLNVSAFNAKILYEASTKTTITHEKFRLMLIESLLQHHRELGRPQGPPVPLQLTRKQTNASLPVNRQQADDAHELTDVSPRKECVVCIRQGRGRKSTHYKCNVCEVPLCVTPCFTIFHHSDEFNNFFSIGTKRRRKAKF